MDNEVTMDPAIEQILSVPTGAESAEASVQAFTADDIAKAREQEKSKLYSQMEKLKSEVDTLKREKEEDAKRKAERLAQRQLEETAKQKAKEEEELSLRDLLAKKEQEFQSQLEAERLERERAFALLEQEQRFQELQNYRTNRIEQERDTIVPELIDLVSGNSTDEIEQSITMLRDKSASILQSAQAAMQATKQQMRGASVTAPASGPLDNEMGQQLLTPDGIRGMDMAEYSKNRARLLGSAAQSRGQGLFG